MKRAPGFEEDRGEWVPDVVQGTIAWCRLSNGDWRALLPHPAACICPRCAAERAAAASEDDGA